MNVIKRSGKETTFEKEKILSAIKKANQATTGSPMGEEDINKVTNKVVVQCEKFNRAIHVEEIQDLVEKELMVAHFYTVAKNYIIYRYEHQNTREMSTLDKKIKGIITVKKNKNGVVNIENEEVKQENSNKNPIVLSVQRDYIAGEWGRSYLNKYVFPEKIKKAHESGLIHIHDTDYIFQGMHNCDLINLEDMLMNGTAISGTRIDSPNSFATACTIASQIAAAVASVQLGGQTMSLAHLAPFVNRSRSRIKKRLVKEFAESNIKYSEEQLNQIVEKEVKKEVESGCQTIQYQLITLHSTNGQAPFITLYMDLNEAKNKEEEKDLALIIEVFLRQRILGVKNQQGHYVAPAFPKLIYCLDENNIHEESEYFWLTKIAAECTAKRMVPDYISGKKMRELKNGDVYPCMGCRSFLTPDRFTDKGIGNIANAKNYIEGKHKYYGRFNQGVVTLNLVDVALSAEGDLKTFWSILEQRLNLCHEVLQLRHNQLKGVPSDVAPILWQDGALARLKHGETIDKLLYDGYSTISLGYAGLAECVYALIQKSHTTPEGEKLGLAIMQRLNDACTKWKEKENIDYSVYGSPIESTVYKFAKTLQKRFGIIPKVTDKNFITNSYHIHVSEEIDAFSKITKESKFQALSPGGAISYVEVPNMQNNIEAVLAVMKHIYNTIIYAELNTKIDLCNNCGYEGEIMIHNKNSKLIWKCPNCGCEDESLLQVVRRTCGLTVGPHKTKVIAGTPLELKQLSINGDIYMANSNGFGIVKSFKIGKSNAAKPLTFIH